MAGRNMEITVAKTAGFCFGVKRAVEKVYDQIATGKKQIYTYGPIIHNEEVVQDLEEKGVQVINSKEELEALKEGKQVDFGDLGKFRLQITSRGADSLEKFTASCITGINIQYVPGEDLKTIFGNLEFQRIDVKEIAVIARAYVFLFAQHFGIVGIFFERHRFRLFVAAAARGKDTARKAESEEKGKHSKLFSHKVLLN